MIKEMPLFCLNRVNFKKNEKAYNSEGSEVLKALKESENDPVEPGMTWICNFVLEIKTKIVENVHEFCVSRMLLSPVYFPFNPILLNSFSNNIQIDRF